MVDEQIDTLFVTDTWLRSQEDEEKSVDMTPGYSMRSFPHSARGGGLAFIVKDTIFDPANVAASFLFSHVSIGLAQLTFTSQQFVSVCVYKPPPSEKN